MNLRFAFIVSFLFFVFTPKIYSEVRFKEAVISPLHEMPSLYPKSYDQEGYTHLLHTLIRWEMTRSMYDEKFSGSSDQIKILSLVTKSAYGMAMFHYFEGIRRGHDDPINAEYNFLKALDYFTSQKDTSGILHTTMHMLRLSLNTTMIEIGNIKRYQKLYEDVLKMGEHTTEPIDKIIYYRMKIIYDEYFYGAKEVSFFKSDIDKSLSIVNNMSNKYGYFKYLMLNAIGIIHSKNIKTIESEKFHKEAFEFIKDYHSLEFNSAVYRIGVMEYYNSKYDEAITTLQKIKDNIPNPRINKNFELIANQNRMLTLIYFRKGDIKLAEKFYEISHLTFVLEVYKENHLLYMQDMAALHKIEEKNKTLRQVEQKQLKQGFILFVTIIVIGLLVIYNYVRSQNQKKLEKEIKHKNFIYSMIGHDLSSPLIDIDMILDDIIIELDEKLDPNQKNYLNKVKTTSQGANLLLNNLLNLYKQESGFNKLNENRLPINVKEEINMSIRHLFNHKYSNMIHLENYCNADIVAVIDKPSFQCVIRNIVDNAIKHSKCTKIIFDASIDVKFLNISISDNGIGLSDNIAGIFNTNKPIQESINETTKIGLGTIFILEFVKALKSELKVKTSKNGTDYTWRIPIK